MSGAIDPGSPTAAQSPTHIVLACDESGAKGYADRDESCPGEVGVFAAILMPAEVMAERLPPFDALIAKYEKYARADDKIHIADLVPETQAQLRADTYDAVKASGLPCFWYAIHVAGLHKWHRHVQKTLAAARASSSSHVKQGSPRENPASMHLELFKGLYGNLIAFLEERGRAELQIEIRTDEIDSPIVKDFDAAARELLSLDPKVKKVTGFDTLTKTRVEAEIRSQFRIPPELAIAATVRSLSLNPVRAGDGLVLAADVLANSLAYKFHNRSAEEKYRDLNTPDAVIGHPLAEYLDSFRNWGTDLVGDRLYAHPLRPN